MMRYGSSCFFISLVNTWGALNTTGDANIVEKSDRPGATEDTSSAPKRPRLLINSH